MSPRIYRYEVPVDDQPHTFRLGSDPLAVGSRRPDVVEFWAAHYSDVLVLTRSFTVVGTGHPLPDNLKTTGRWHWGTVPVADGAGVWHLIEVTA